jgi:hypothetical protein
MYTLLFPHPRGNANTIKEKQNDCLSGAGENALSNETTT